MRILTEKERKGRKEEGRMEAEAKQEREKGELGMKSNRSV